MKAFLTTFVLLCGIACADSVRPYGDDSVVIKFDEPVVPRSACQNWHLPNATDADKGLDLFDVTGDDAHRPQLRWVNQNALIIKFAPGTACSTEYRLSFRPDCGKYLSGKEMPGTSFTFRHEPVDLDAAEVPGMEPGAHLVFPEEGDTQESLTFSGHKGVTFTYRQVLDEEKPAAKDDDDEDEIVEHRYGASVPAVVGLAQLKHVYAGEVFDAWAETQPDWDGLTQESAIPTAVLVRPASPLPAGTRWQLCSGETPAFHELKSAVFPVEDDIPTGVYVHLGDDGAAYTIGIGVDAFITEEEALRVFREMEVGADGVKAVTSADGKSKTLTVNGKECRLVYKKLTGPKVDVYTLKGDEVTTGYHPAGGREFRMALEGELPQVLDIVLPEGVTTVFGRKTTAPHHHRISITPAWPDLRKADGGYTDDSTHVAFLPLKGAHKVRVQAVEMDSLSVEAYRLSAETVLKNETDLLQLHAYNRNELQYALQSVITQKADAEGIRKLPEDWKGYVQNAAERLRYDVGRYFSKASGLTREAAHKKAASFTAGSEPMKQDITLPADRHGCLEAVVDLDAMAGGRLAPGYYLICIKTHAAPAVRGLLEGLGLQQDLLDDPRYMVVRVSDLVVSYHGDTLLATRLSDGSFVRQAKVTCHPDTRSDDTAPAEVTVHELKDGFLCLPEATDPGTGSCIVEAGEDYAVVDKSPLLFSNERTHETTYLQTDRPLYLPGDTVHVRGVLRYRDDHGVASEPKAESVIFTVRGPDDQDLITRTVALDASGGIDESFTLPADGEGVTGTYYVGFETPDELYYAETTVDVQVFRRNAFSVEAEMDVAPLRPARLDIRVQAKDYNGTPVAGGKARLEITSDIPLHTIDGRPAESLLAAPSSDTGMDIYEEEEDDDDDDYSMGSFYMNDEHTYAIDIVLDAQGRAEVHADILEEAYTYARQDVIFRISGSVANDRGEHVVLQEVREEAETAEFRIDYQWEGVLKLIAAGEGEDPLQHDQVVHVDVSYREETTRNLPNGIILSRNRKVTLSGEDILVPAGAEDGVEWDYRPLLQRLGVKDGKWEDAHLVFTAKDSQGRVCKKEMELENPETAFYDVKPHRKMQLALGGDGMLHVRTHFVRSAETLFIVSDEFGAYQCHLRPVQQGGHETVLPAEGMQGVVQVQAIQMQEDAKGHFLARVTADDEVTLPHPFALQTTLQVPQEPVRPGSDIRLSGQVTRDGKGVPATVTLFAVDEGTLDLERYFDTFHVEDLLDVFTGNSNKVGLSSFTPDIKYKKSEDAPSLTQMPGLWQGTELTKLRMRIPWFRKYSHTFSTFNDNSKYEEGTDDDDDECEEGVTTPCMVSDAADYTPRLRLDFRPVAVWQGVVKTDAEGRFSTDATLPDTLTTYKVFALVLGDDASSFGNAEAEFTVDQPLMLTPGTPLFMSVGDTLRLPLTVTNNTDEEGTWTVSISSAAEPQKVTIPARGTATLYFDFMATQEGETALEWKAVGGTEGDAVRGTFPVRFPAPVLKEERHVLIAAGTESKLAALVSPELAESGRAEVELRLSANPLLHLAGNMDYLLEYPYGCTEQTSSGLLPWLLHKRLAPLCPRLAKTPAAEVDKVIRETIGKLFKRQKKDGGFGYWDDSSESCAWASAHAVLVLVIAQEQGYGDCIPKDKMQLLLEYVRKQGYMKKAKADTKLFNLPRVFGMGRTADAKNNPDLQFISKLRKNPAAKHEAFLQWMRSRGHDSRHTTTHDSAWMFIALHEYLRLTPASTAEATATLPDGTSLTLDQGVTALRLQQWKGALKAVKGDVYATLAVKARPERTEFAGVTENGLQVTRIYEKKGADGIWREAKEFSVGDVVRVTLTCAKAEPELQYFVLEDYLPSCMEAINPAIPSQAAGLESAPWSLWFDHKEYLADRVRGFCTRWVGKDLLNMTYYARIMRAGTCTAPPAQAQLMYEPQTYGLSPNTKVQSK